MAIRDLRGLMRDLLERIHFSRLKHENTGLESVSNIQVEQRRLPAYLKAKTEIIWAIEKENESQRAPPRDLRGLMRDLLERIHFGRLKHENTGLESVSIIQILTQITNNCTVK